MMKETIELKLKLADQLISARVNFPIMRKKCEDYIVSSDQQPDVSIEIGKEDIFQEARRNGESLGEEQYQYGGAYFETTLLYRKICEALVNRGVLLIHGSVIAVDGQAYLFTAPSGTGKSTHTALWREYFGERAIMVNDDKPLIKIEDGRVLACGTPWNGKHHLGNNVLVPLKAICYLERDEVNAIACLKPESAFSYVYRQTYRPQDKILMAQTLELISKLLNAVPVYKMKINNFRDDAVTTAYEGMKGDS